VKAETLLFGGVTVFFGISAAVYGWWSQEPTGTATLVVAAAMAALVTFYLWYTHTRVGTRPEDRKDGEILDAAGTSEFFPPDTAYPLLTAAGLSVTALGVVLGLWLFLLGLGILAPGVGGFFFQFGRRTG
jgi:Cytochrome c oxidase subunit IV